MRLLSIPAIAAFLASAAFADPPPPAKRKGPGGFMKKGAPPSPPGGAADRFLQLSPAQQKEAIHQLPPERREVLERRLEQWRNTPAEERRRLEGSYAKFQEMPPEKQEEVRQLFRRVRESFSADRAAAAHAAIRRLRRAEPGERKKLLETGRFQKEFNEEERKLLDQIAGELPEHD
ncbi:MAG TPA: DUF3106 domain-containing protein [Bryobacteraceae bacterium]|nr:DUF3106 domain-containing protein [Bryobacteraceae bacterium]